MSDHLKANLDRILADFVKNGPAGCACAVARGGQVVYEGYQGYADLAGKRPMAEDTVFRLWSLTKVIVCTAAMTLYEQGRFLLNDPVYAYLPEWKDHTIAEMMPDGQVNYVKSKGPMLVKHAFSMAVGMPYFMTDSVTGRAMAKVQDELIAKHGKYYTLQTELKAMSQVPIAFEPGSHFLYGYGHELVAGIIEATSGMTVGEYLKKTIFEPLGMANSGYRYTGDMEQRVATFYRRGDDGSLTPTQSLLDAHGPNDLMEAGGGGLLSSAKDYLTFAQMLAAGGTWRGHRVIGRKTIDLMRRNHLNEAQLKDFTNSYLAGYGYGLGVRTMMDPAAGGSNGSVGEFGWTGGSGTWAAIDPDEDLAIVYMHQMMPNLEEYHHLRVRAAVNAGL